MRLRGEELLERIATIHKTSNLFSYKGNLRDVAIACGYMKSTHKYDEKISQQIISDFCLAYWKAIKKPKRKRYKGNTVFDNKELFFKELTKKYKHIPSERELEEKEKKEQEEKLRKELLKAKPPRVKQGKVKQIFDESIKENYEKEALTKRANTKSGLLFYDKLTGHKLLNEVIKLRHFGKTETSICVITGYEVSKIGVFRRQFAKAAGVKLAPLKMMIKEMKEKDFLVSVANKAKEVKPNQENIETRENTEEQEIFINREKISSQVKRLYRNPKFREKILKQHGSICSCCDIAMEKLIEAAHIIPVEDNGNDEVKNGIPLCPTHHTAFDNFLFTISPTNNSIVYKEGLTSEDLQITKTECKLNVSKESLEYRFKLFNED